jgi:hypothetical protein
MQAPASSAELATKVAINEVKGFIGSAGENNRETGAWIPNPRKAWIQDGCSSAIPGK